MKKLLFLLAVPVFYINRPDVAYEQVQAVNMDYPGIQRKDPIACSVISEYGDHRLIEGTLLTKTPFILLSDTPLFSKMPVAMGLYPTVEFCIVDGSKHE